ncbi:MAG: UDP-N-acetylmuramoyl-L-alanyl-D-glutamate--2,6-diaminopimelate ligase [bacterium]
MGAGIIALAELLQHVELLETRGDLSVRINKVEVDSRQITKGDLFIAVPGYAADGTQFVADALSRGAAAILSTRPVEAPGVCNVVVKDIRSTVAKIAARYFDYPAHQLRLIGITGTNGKTTVTHLLRSILEASGESTGLIGTLGYYVGAHSYPPVNTTPGPLLLEKLLAEMRDHNCHSAVMEVSSHALAMSRVLGLEFAAVGITNVSQDHLDFHPTFEDYRATNGRLLAQLKAEAGVAVQNRDDESYDYFAGQCRGQHLSYSFDKQNADFYLSDLSIAATGSQFTLHTPKGEVEVKIDLLGRFNVANALCAAAVAGALEISPEQIAAGLSAQRFVNGRAEPVEAGQPFTVLVDYAHTPDALAKIGETAREFCKGRLIMLFGCGGDRDRTKRAPMGAAACANADLVVVTSDNPRSEDPLAIIEDIKPGLNNSTEVLIEPDREKAIKQALDLCTDRDLLVVAGKGHETYQIIGDQRLRFDDREVIIAHLKERYR